MEVITSLERSGELEGKPVEVIDTALTDDRIGESDMVLINDTPIEQLVSAGVQNTECLSCGDLIGNPICCREVQSVGETEETLPMEIIKGSNSPDKRAGPKKFSG